MSELQAILHAIEMVDKQIKTWKSTHCNAYAQDLYIKSAETLRFDDDSYTSNELLLLEFAKLTQRKGELERLAEKHYPNPEICKAIGYGFYMHIHNEIRFNTPRFRGCYGLDKHTRMLTIPAFHHRVAVPISRDATPDEIGASWTESVTYTDRRMRNITLMWSRVGAIDGVRVVWDYDIQSNTLFIQDS